MSGKSARLKRQRDGTHKITTKEQRSKDRAIWDKIAQTQGFEHYDAFDAVCDAVIAARQELTPVFANRREWRDTLHRCEAVLLIMRMIGNLMRDDDERILENAFELARHVSSDRTPT